MLSIVVTIVEGRYTRSADLGVMVGLVVVGFALTIVARRWSHDVRHMGFVDYEYPTTISWHGVLGNGFAVVAGGVLAMMTYRQTGDRLFELGMGIFCSIAAFFVAGRVPYVKMFKPRARELPKLRVQWVSILALTMLVVVIELATLVEGESPASARIHELAIGLYFALVPVLVVSTIRVRSRLRAARRSWGGGDPGALGIVAAPREERSEDVPAAISR